MNSFASIMKFVTWTVLLWLTCAMGVRAQSLWNNNSLLEIQKRGGDPQAAGDVAITFYGHDAFRITSPHGLTVLADPWRNDAIGKFPKWFLSVFPPLDVDIVVSTHAHFDHDAVNSTKGLMVLQGLVGKFSLGDVEITGLGDKHVCQPATGGPACPPNNDIALDNAIQVVSTGGLRIAIWGDNRAVPPSVLDSYLSNLDVLILPVVNVLSPAEADAIIARYTPRAVIPSHYFIPGLTAKSSGLDPVENWVTAQERSHRVVRLAEPNVTLNARQLRKGRSGTIYYFGDHFDRR